MALPTLTADQRAEALEKARRARRERADVLARIKAGALNLPELFEMVDANPDSAIGRARVEKVLRALPGIGVVTASRLMGEVGILESRKVAALRGRQRADLLVRVNEKIRS